MKPLKYQESFNKNYGKRSVKDIPDERLHELEQAVKDAELDKNDELVKLATDSLNRYKVEKRIPITYK